MEGNMLYHEYLKPGTEYYEKNPHKKQVQMYELNQVPSNYNVLNMTDSVWVHYEPVDQVLPDQGWKIHISTSFEEAEKVIEVVSNLCFKKNLVFKHLKDQGCLIKINSKNADRASSGKFITIYPENNERFVFMLEELSLALKEFTAGPYILNDKRWGNSNVFYRYGGFKAILNEHGEYCIRDDQGQLIPDHRKPYYEVPEFVRPFDEYLSSINIIENLDSNQNSQLEKYEFETALSQSNAGGVYLAKVKLTGQKVIIKEARPKAGLDGLTKDAIERQNIEQDALSKLREVEGVVNLIDTFEEWEHSFLVEEFIEGEELRAFIARYYPYTEKNDIESHAEKVKSISTQLFTIIEDIHNKGVAMGDLQPANIIITEDLTVKLIDFETAKPVRSSELPSMATTGFVSQDMKVSGARDWYGFKKIIKYLSLPVLTSEDTEKYLQNNHFRWIKQVYGEDFHQFLFNLTKKADFKILELQDHTESSVNVESWSMNLSSIIEKLTEGLEKDLTTNSRFIRGDIRQHEMKNGKLNFLTGGSGAAYTLTKAKVGTEKVDQWIQTHMISGLSKVTESGLLTGKSGIFALLSERGHLDMVLREIPNLLSTTSDDDITLRSGLSGVGLFFISLYFETNNEVILQSAIELSERIEKFISNGKSIKLKDWAAVDVGLIDGLSGVSLFYSALYAATSEEKYFHKAKEYLNRDLTSTQVDKNSDILQTLDEKNRLLPYLSGGSIGIGVAIWFLNHVSGQALYQKELESILKLSQIRCTITGSLFDGAGSFLILPCMAGDVKRSEDVTNKVLQLLDLFLIKKESYYKFPGHFSYRLSDDIYTGSAGIILALLGIRKNNPMHWLPLVNIDGFLESAHY